MLFKILKKRAKQLLYYVSVLSLVLSVVGTVYAGESYDLEPKVKQIETGFCHTVILKEDGTVWTWGLNNYGQLGDDTAGETRGEPRQVEGVDDVIEIAAGYGHTVVLKADGSVWAWGYNQHGQLGDGTTTNRTQPKKITGLEDVIHIAAGYRHTVALKSDGEVWAWGYNLLGQLGDGTMIDKIAPVKAIDLGDVAQVIAGPYHTMAVTEDGTLYTWGYNDYGQLGDGTKTTRTVPTEITSIGKVVQAVGGAMHTVALKEDGTVWTWGYNGYGQLGDGTRTSKAEPVWVTGIAEVTQIGAGFGHTVALKADGTAWAWGYNVVGQLGDGTTTDRTEPVQTLGLGEITQLATDEHFAVALKADGTVWGWGHNGYGQLGDDTFLETDVPVQSVLKTTEIVLFADTSDNDVVHDLEITFLPNRTYEKHIDEVTVNGTSLEEDIDYTVESGKITLMQSGGSAALRTAGDAEVIVSAKFFPDSKVTQPINNNIATHMVLQQDIKPPIANKGSFATQPVIYIVDKYGLICINDHTTQVTVSKHDSGDWSLEGTTTVVAKGGIATFTDLKATNDGKIEGAQLSFSAIGLEGKDILSDSVTLPAELPPTVPQIESVEEGDGCVTLGWRDAEGARGYEVYASTMPQSYTTPVALTISVAHSYEITGLENGTTYYFVVRAVNEGGASDYSNEVSSVPRTVPSPPSNIKATAGNKKATVSFHEPLDNGGSPVIKYVVTSYPDNRVAEGIKSPITVNGLKNGIRYTFTVKAINKAGASHESEPSNAVVPKRSSGGGGGTTGGSGGTTSDNQKESDKDVLDQNNQETHDSKVDGVIEINGKSVQNIAQLILRTQNGKRVAELIIDEEKLKEAIKQAIQTTGQATIRYIFGIAEDGKEIEQVIYKISEEMAKSSGYVEMLIPLPKNMNEDKVITGVRTLEDGSLCHVPTKLITLNDKKYARIKTRLEGTYLLTNQEKSFKDIKGHWSKDIVNELASRLILEGNEKGNFQPSKKATREEFAVIITKALGLMQKGAGKDLFSDVSKEDTYYDAVTIAYEYGIISGYQDKSFRADKKITREEAMTMTIRAMKVVGMEVSLDEAEINSLLSRYTDNSSISPWAREYAALCIKLGIVTGRNDKTIAPKDAISMAEIAVVVNRLLEVADLI